MVYLRRGGEIESYGKRFVLYLLLALWGQKDWNWPRWNRSLSGENRTWVKPWFPTNQHPAYGYPLSTSKAYLVPSADGSWMTSRPDLVCWHKKQNDARVQPSEFCLMLGYALLWFFADLAGSNFYLNEHQNFLVSRKSRLVRTGFIFNPILGIHSKIVTVCITDRVSNPVNRSVSVNPLLQYGQPSLPTAVGFASRVAWISLH